MTWYLVLIYFGAFDLAYPAPGYEPQRFDSQASCDFSLSIEEFEMSYETAPEDKNFDNWALACIPVDSVEKALDFSYIINGGESI